jgi:hypothetical protein
LRLADSVPRGLDSTIRMCVMCGFPLVSSYKVAVASQAPFVSG